MAKILVTGVNGFVGHHLAAELAHKNCLVVGAGREPNYSTQLSAYFACDLTDPKAVRKLPLEEIDGVISLAGLAQVGASFSSPDLYKEVNVKVLSVLCEELLSRKLNPRIVAISTGALYDPHQPLPLTEDSKLVKDGSPYAISKILMEEAAQKFRKKGLDCVIVRPFNHAGPGQNEGFLIPDLWKKLKGNESGVVKVGNLDSKRDYTDVRDVVRAYSGLVLAKSLPYNLFNVCNECSLSGYEILELLLKASGAGDIKIEKDPALIRPNDAPDIYGSHQRLTAVTGWQPKIPIEQTIKDFVEASS